MRGASPIMQFGVGQLHVKKAETICASLRIDLTGLSLSFIESLGY